MFIKEAELKRITAGSLEEQVDQVAGLIQGNLEKFGCGGCPNFYAEVLATWSDRVAVLTSREEIWEAKIRRNRGGLVLGEAKRLAIPTIEAAQEALALGASEEDTKAALSEMVRAAVRRRSNG